MDAMSFMYLSCWLFAGKICRLKWFIKMSTFRSSLNVCFGILIVENGPKWQFLSLLYTRKNWENSFVICVRNKSRRASNNILKEYYNGSYYSVHSFIFIGICLVVLSVTVNVNVMICVIEANEPHCTSICPVIFHKHRPKRKKNVGVFKNLTHTDHLVGLIEYISRIKIHNIYWQWHPPVHTPVRNELLALNYSQTRGRRKRCHLMNEIFTKERTVRTETNTHTKWVQ